MSLCGRGQVWFKDNQGETPVERVRYEKEAIQNALILYQLGEDYRKYLEEKNITVPDAWDKVFPSVDDDLTPEPDIDIASLLGNSNEA